MNTSQTKIGYARTSTTDQNLDAQVAALKAAGCGMVRTEQKSGARLEGRPELKTILDFIHLGETLVVTRIDRLARSMSDLQSIVERLKAKGAHLAATEQPVDTSTASGKALRRFPDARDCLVRAERDKLEPNLLLIDWRRVGWVKGFEVCLFRIGRSVGSMERIIAWLSYHEFRVFSSRRFRNETYQPRFENDPMFSVQASCSKDYKNEAVGKPWFDFFPNSADTVNIVFNDNMKVAGVSAETTTK